MAKLKMTDVVKGKAPEVSKIAEQIGNEFYKRMKSSVEDQLIYHGFDPVKNLVEMHNDKMTPVNIKMRINSELLSFTKPKMASVTINTQQVIDLKDIVESLDGLHG